MSEATGEKTGDGGGEVEMVTWVSPDKVEIQVPVDQLEGLNGVTKRFNDLPKKEQAIAEKEKTFTQQLDDAREEAKDSAFENMDKESLLLLAASQGIDLTDKEVEEVVEEGKADPKLAADLAAMKERLDTKDAAEEQAAEDAKFAGAEQEVANEFAAIADSSDDFKALNTEHFQNVAYSGAWEALEGSNWNMSYEDAMAAGIKTASGIQAESAEAYAKSKDSGPGAPGKGAGEVQRPESFANDEEREAYMADFIRNSMSRAEDG